jgi:hypothetical protein
MSTAPCNNQVAPALETEAVQKFFLADYENEKDEDGSPR